MAYNFYSSGENVLENSKGMETVPGNLTEFGLTRHAWVNQEIGKGCQNSSFASLTTRCQGGWKFNNNEEDLKFIGKQIPDPQAPIAYLRLSAQETKDRFDTNKLTKEHIAQFGWFTKFEYPELYAPIDESKALLVGGPTHQQVNELLSGKNGKEALWTLLSHAIPASSFATGANRIETLDNGILDRNINMQSLRNKKDGQYVWPLQRIDGEPLTDYDWWHSDVKEMALPYVYQVYEKMLDIGQLREQ